MFAINGLYPHPEFSATDHDSRFVISSVSNRNNNYCSTTGSNASYATAFLTHPVPQGQKVYIEFTSQTFEASMCIGVAGPSFSHANPLGSTADSVCYYLGDGTTANSAYWNINNSFPSNGQNMQTAAQSSIWGLAIDGVNGKLWMRVYAGNWNNDMLANQNPATNTGGFVVGSPIFGLSSFRIGISSQNNGETILLWPGAANPPPAGFHTYGSLNVL